MRLFRHAPLAPGARRRQVTDEKATPDERKSRVIVRTVADFFFPRASDFPVATRDWTYLTTSILVFVGWKDRLRVLVSGRVRLDVRTYTDVEVLGAESDSLFSVDPPSWRPKPPRRRPKARMRPWWMRKLWPGVQA